MNIGIFTDTYFPQINGVVTSTKVLADELTALGHNVYIFTPKDPGMKNDKEHNVYRIMSVPAIFLPDRRMTLIYPPKLLLTFRKLKLDIIHTQTEFSLGLLGRLVAKFYKIPSVHTYHTMYEDYVHHVANGHLITPPMAKKYSKFFCNQSEAVISPAEKTKTALLKYGVTKPVEVIPTGLLLSKFKKTNYDLAEINKIKSELGIKNDHKVILFLGRISKEKSIDVIISQMPSILKSHSNAILLIVGDGGEKKYLEDLSKKLNVQDSVIFAGARPWSEIGKYYQLGHVYVTASVTETQGLTYIETMASEIPLVAKNDGSVQGLINNGFNGYTFNEDEELVSCIDKVFNNHDKTQEIIKNALLTSENFSSENFGKKVESFYTLAIENYKKGKFFRFNWKKKSK